MCVGPLTAYYSAQVNRNGKRPLVFDKRLSCSGVPIEIGCRQCIECRLDDARKVAVRCMNEMRMHSQSCFLTLTYDDKKLPLAGTLRKDHLQKFFKRLRHDTGDGLRYYACGEYGESYLRPHYHALLFNYDFPDKRFHSVTDRDHELYVSKRLDKIWGYGHTIIGSVDFESCAYVAGYITKKITGPPAAEHYYGREDEFRLCSLKPGLGHGYYMKYGHEIYAHDSIVINGRPSRPPRYYDEMYKALDSMGLADIKKRRLVRFRETRNRADETSRRRRVKELVIEARMRLKGRVL